MAWPHLDAGGLLRGAVSRLRGWLPMSVALTAVLQTMFLVVFVATDRYDVARRGEAVRLVATYATLFALFELVHLATKPRSRLHLPLTLAVFGAFVAVNFARFETNGAFDYGFAHENVHELLTPLGRRTVGSQVQAHEVFLLLLVPLASGAALLRWRSSPWPGSPRSRALAAIACAVTLTAIPAFGVNTHESLTAFVASAFRFHMQPSLAEASTGDDYPYVHEFLPSREAAALAREDAPRPHVILLFLESWSGIYTDHPRPNGEPYTPVFDAERRKGLTFDHFYGNSIQSSRGRFATLCSLVPMARAKEFTYLRDTPLHCLPQVLAEAGYATLLSSASDEPLFENSDAFFHHMGIEDVRFEMPSRREIDPTMWGAGLQDDVYYRSFFAMLDDRVATEPNRPIFAIAINASNHYPFRDDPEHRPEQGLPTKYARDYVASLRAEDARLAVFFEELDRRPAFRDALVVLVGDHSFPADEHGIHFNGLGAYEESFRTAFALRWRGHVPPKVVTDRTASQIDLAPTVTDLLRIRHTTQFVGRSLVRSDEPWRPAPLVQPYDGIRLVAVRYPFKLERHEAAGQEHLYDLSRDPDEEVDRLDDTRLSSELAELRQAIARMHTSEQILHAQRIWPAP